MTPSRLIRWGLTPFLLFFCAGAMGADETVALVLPDGRPLAATLRKPDDAAGPLPAILLLGGFRGAAQVLDKVRTPQPVIWASFDYPFTPPRKFSFPGSLKHAPELRQAIADSFDGVVALHALLAARADVDPGRITAVGASAGAPFALVGAQRAGIPGLVVVQGFARPREVVEHLLERRWRPRIGAAARGPAWLLAHFIAWYCEFPDLEAPARGLRAGQRALMVTASEDDFIPQAASDALWAALEDSAADAERLELPGRHLGRRDDGEQVAEILSRSLEWMQREGLLQVSGRD